MKAKLEQILADVVGAPVSVTRPEPQFGDFATNVAMQLAGQQGRSPREIAEDIANKLRQQPEITEVTVAGPGFINIHLSDTALIQALQAQPAQTLAGQTVLAEYSDPNPFKPLHAGHLYTTLVGDVLSRILEAAGAQVIRLNFGGDVGPHVARSMWAIVQELGGEDPSKLTEVEDRPRWLGERYVEGNNAYEDNPEAQAEIKEYNRRIYEIQATGDHESPLAQIYWTCRQWSYDYFAELYRQLQVKPFDRFIPESEVTPLGLATVQKELQNGVFTESDGAVVFPGEKYGLHTRVFINQQGLPTYEAKDVGLSLTKWQDYPDFTESIIITANEQAEYMRVVLAAIKQFAPEPAERTKHLTHGMVKLAGGVKMSSRKGNVVTALELLEAARQAAPEASEETILAAVKYALTKNRMGGDIAYDPRESIALEGNSGPYLQYAHARARSILAKLGGLQPLAEVTLEPDERVLVAKLGQFTEVVDLSVQELMPHHICTYLYELAQEFNRFYERNRVVDDPRQVVRAGLVLAYADTLRRGLDLLGIHAPERM
ncbi:MAG TPA: arginine--tRNA ligase [Candidatus Saccharibacteria bacterium]|nr:arginine--tRNA ligase [Candidatus Saccharibacteria bacterium]